jgi:antitoxin FitA
MSTLTIRNLDTETKNALKSLGAEHGRSMEAEVRVILAAAVRARMSEAVEGLGSRIRTRFDGIEWDGGARRDDEPRAAGLDA